MQKGEVLWVVMPVYNEQDAIEQVLTKWLQKLRAEVEQFVFCVINDGSQDNSLSIIQRLAEHNPEIQIVDHANRGHGQSCIQGYKLAIDNGADWIFQIDSDNQCNPKYFGACVKESKASSVVYGFRKTRSDGWRRTIVSRIVTLFVWGATSVWVRDANVPYRLMKRETLTALVNKVPNDFHLANILVSTYQEKVFGIKWVDIHFDDRFGGEPSIGISLFAQQGLALFKQLKKTYSNIIKSTNP